MFEGGALNTMRSAKCHPKYFVSPLSPNDPLIYALPPIDPYFLSVKDPQFLICHPKTPISDFVVTQKPIILIIWPKLWLVTITEARILRELKPTFYYTLTERPHNLWSVPKYSSPHFFVFFGCFCQWNFQWKTPMSEVLGGTCTSLWYMSAPRGLNMNHDTQVG